MSAKKEAKPKIKTGRKPLDIDPRLVENLAGIGCTLPEIAAAVNCHQDTLLNRFSEEIAKGRENGKTRLRKKQLEIALKGNVVMLIWLGKQILGQSDRVGLEHSGPGGGPIKTQEMTPELEEKILAVARINGTLSAPQAYEESTATDD